jgi:hypothetical protein
MDKTPQAIQCCHELHKWMIPQLDKFPRNRRFTLGEKIELQMLEVMSLLIEAQYASRGKGRILNDINIKLTLIRHLWRLAFELKVTAQKTYRYGSQLLVELGKQIGGWQKASR